MPFHIGENEKGQVEVGLIGNSEEIDAETALAWAAVAQVEVLRRIEERVGQIEKSLDHWFAEINNILS